MKSIHPVSVEGPPVGVMKRKLIRSSDQGLVRTSRLYEGRSLPLLIQPAAEGVDLAGWAQRSRTYIESLMLKHGALLFRGFGMGEQRDFEQFLQSISLRSMDYMEGATPRTDLGGRVYTSTEFPPDQHIALHNELSYVLTWPMKICFFCITPAQTGGETPIADVRRVFNRIPFRIRERFVQKGWMLVRNFGDGFSLPWQTTFRTVDKSELEAYCRAGRITWEWKDQNRLRTRQVRPAIALHPQTEEIVWFNHVAFWHVSSLEAGLRDMLLNEFEELDLPYNTYYGDGTSIEDSVIEEIREAYRLETVAAPWQKGDLLLMDNMLVAHGRRPFTAPRKIVVSMGVN